MACRESLQELRDTLIKEETVEGRYKRGMMNFTGLSNNDSLFTRNAVMHALWRKKTEETDRLKAQIRERQLQNDREGYSSSRGCREPYNDRHFEYVSDRVNRLSRELRDESASRFQR
eukprot:TRINITY_DN61139_c0_g1_i1.p1 TRINITY_DN61139_c0_g1~~TRINITY_DN61139_c0_g1_i1.p1  ORF type:complete len:117 (+),score=30.95 TRINITY_DN61139_c0_g1_i1:191-541(+)